MRPRPCETGAAAVAPLAAPLPPPPPPLLPPLPSPPPPPPPPPRLLLDVKWPVASDVERFEDCKRRHARFSWRPAFCCTRTQVSDEARASCGEWRPVQRGSRRSALANLQLFPRHCRRSCHRVESAIRAIRVDLSLSASAARQLKRLKSSRSSATRTQSERWRRRRRRRRRLLHTNDFQSNRHSRNPLSRLRLAPTISRRAQLPIRRNLHCRRLQSAAHSLSPPRRLGFWPRRRLLLLQHGLFDGLKRTASWHASHAAACRECFAQL